MTGEARRPGDAGRHCSRCRAGSWPSFSISASARSASRTSSSTPNGRSSKRVAENIMTDWLGLPPLASAHGGQIDSLIGWMHVFMLILFVGWGGFFVYCLIRFRRSRHPVADYTGVKSHASNYSEIARGRGRSDSPVRILDPDLGREGRPHPAGERSAGRSGHRRAVRLERPLCRPRRGIRPHGHQADRRRSRTPWDSIATILPRRTTSRRSISSICP